MDALSLLGGEACGRVFSVLRVANPPGVSLRELGRLAKVSLSSLQREVARLEKLGLLARRREGQRLFLNVPRKDPAVRVMFAALATRDLEGSYFERFPADRALERTFVQFCSYMPPEPQLWAKYGDRRFLAGVALWLSSHSGFNRSTYLGLATALDPSVCTLRGYRHWHTRYRPDSSRLFGIIDRERQTHARVEAEG